MVGQLFLCVGCGGLPLSSAPRAARKHAQPNPHTNPTNQKKHNKQTGSARAATGPSTRTARGGCARTTAACKTGGGTPLGTRGRSRGRTRRRPACATARGSAARSAPVARSRSRRTTARSRTSTRFVAVFCFLLFVCVSLFVSGFFQCCARPLRTQPPTTQPHNHHQLEFWAYVGVAGWEGTAAQQPDITIRVSGDKGGCVSRRMYDVKADAYAPRSQYAADYYWR